MSHQGSPTDDTGKVEQPVAGASPASDAIGATDQTPGSGDANSSASPSSGDSDNGAKDPVEKLPTLSEVIRTAADKPTEDGASPSPAKTTPTVDPSDPAPDAKAEADKTAKADDEKLPFHDHPRWKEVMAERRQLSEKVADLEPRAAQFDTITSFMNENTLTPDEVGEGFIIMAMLKNNDPRGLQKLDEYRDRLATTLGEKIPTDIQEQIDTGEISEAAGLEMSKTRARAAIAETRQVQTQTQFKTREQENAVRVQSESFQRAATVWENGIRSRDIDFAKKEKAIERFARALILERGQPTNPEQAVAILQDAYDEVNKTVQTFAPPKQPVARMPNAPSSTGARPQPKSLLEAVRVAAAK